MKSEPQENITSAENPPSESDTACCSPFVVQGASHCCDQPDQDIWWRRIECQSCGKKGFKGSSKKSIVELWNRYIENGCAGRPSGTRTKPTNSFL